jgi:hypothetical protein
MDPTKIREAIESRALAVSLAARKVGLFSADDVIALCDALAAATARAETAEAECEHWKDAADRYCADMIESGFKLRQAREALETAQRALRTGSHPVETLALHQIGTALAAMSAEEAKDGE